MNAWSKLGAAVFLACAALSAQAGEIPQSATLKYSGSYGIPATMTFKRSGNSYTVSANINVPLYKIRFESGGTIVGNQLKPSYYRDVRNGKVYASAQFAGGKATYGRAGDVHTEAVAGSVMDLFTLSWQLAFNDGKLPTPLVITNGKKLYPISRLTPSPSKDMTIGSLKTRTQAFNLRHDNDHIFLALASDLGNVPALIRYNVGGKKYSLTLKAVKMADETAP